VNQLEQEILSEMLTEEELKDLIQRFQDQHAYAPEKYTSCSACGLRTYGNECKKTRLDSEHAQKFKMSDNQKADHERKRADPAASIVIYIDAHTTKRVNAWDIVSAYQSEMEGEGNWYHLHPELVDKDGDGVEWVSLCQDCYPNKKKRRHKESATIGEEEGFQMPERSIAAGVDFGWARRLGLSEPNLHEQMVLSFNRLYMTCYKVTSNQTGRINVNLRTVIKTLAVMFAQDAPIAAALSMMRISPKNLSQVLEQDFILQLLDKNGRFDYLAQRVLGSGTMFARWWQLFSFLSVLKVILPHFKDIVIPSIEHLQSACEEARRNLINNAERIKDKATIEIENTVASDVLEAQQMFTEEPIPLSAGQNDEEEVPVNVSFVFNDPSVEAAMNPDQMTKQCIKSLEKLVKGFDSTVDDNREECKAEEMDGVHTTEPLPAVTLARNQACTSGNRTSPVALPPLEEDDWGAPGTEVVSDLLSHTWSANAVSRRSNVPINKFSNQDILPKAFPTTFMLGKAYKVVGASLGVRQLHHAMHQFTTVPSKDQRLVGYLFDSGRRIAVTREVCASVKASPKAQACISQLVEQKAKQIELLEAIRAYPDMKKAKAAMKTYGPHISYSGRNVSGGLHESFRLRSEINESCRRHGSGGSFDTLSFNDIDNPRSFRASFWTTNNNKFPACFETNCPFGETGNAFLGNLSKTATEVAQMEIDGRGLDKFLRARAAAEDPIAYVDECKRLIADACFILFGMPLEHFFSRDSGYSTRKTWCYTCNKGILGYCRAMIGVMEDHARGTLHFHIIFIGGLSPFALQYYASNARLCAAMSKVIDSQHTAEFPAQVLLSKLISQHVRFKVAENDTMVPPSTVPFILRKADLTSICRECNHPVASQILKAEATRVCKKEFHNHVKTCHDRKSGKRGCRFCMPQALRHKTHPVELLPNPCKGQDTGEGTKELSYISREVELTDAAPRHKLKNVLQREVPLSTIAWEPQRRRTEDLISITEERGLSRQAIMEQFHNGLEGNDKFEGWIEFWAWLEALPEEELQNFYLGLASKLPKANGFVAAFNPILSCLTNCHNNICLLGAVEQSIGATFYICPYMGKKNFHCWKALPYCITA